MAVSIGPGVYLAPFEIEGDVGSGIGFAPDRYFSVSLQHHVVAEEMREAQLGEQRCWSEEN